MYLNNSKNIYKILMKIKKEVILLLLLISMQCTSSAISPSKTTTSAPAPAPKIISISSIDNLLRHIVAPSIIYSSYDGHALISIQGLNLDVSLNFEHFRNFKATTSTVFSQVQTQI